jgi:hypothetical protein
MKKNHYHTGKRSGKVYLTLNEANAVVNEEAALDRPVGHRLVVTGHDGRIHPSLFPSNFLTPEVYPRDIELRVHQGRIQWRYVDDSEWLILVPLSEISGKNGKTPVLSIKNGTLSYRYDNDDEWTPLVDLSQLASVIKYSNPKTKVAVGGIDSGTVLQNIPLRDILDWMFNGSPHSYDLDKTALSIVGVVNAKRQQDYTAASYKVFSFFRSLAEDIVETSQALINEKAQVYLTALSVLSKVEPSLEAVNAMEYYASTFVQEHYPSAKWTNFITKKTEADALKSAVDDMSPPLEINILACIDDYLEAVNFLLD